MSKKARQYEHLKNLLTHYPGAFLKVWFSQEDCYEGEVEIDDVLLIEGNSEFSIDELLEDLDEQAEICLLEDEYEAKQEASAEVEALAAEGEAITTAQAEGYASWQEEQGHCEIEDEIPF